MDHGESVLTLVAGSKISPTIAAQLCDSAKSRWVLQLGSTEDGTLGLHTELHPQLPSFLLFYFESLITSLNFPGWVQTPSTASQRAGKIDVQYHVGVGIMFFFFLRE